MESIKLCIREKNAALNRIVVKNITIETLTYDDLINKHAKDAKKHCTDFVAIFRGKLLKKDIPLHEQGIKDGCIVQIMCRQVAEPTPKPTERFTELTCQSIVIKFRAVSTANFHKVGDDLAQAVYKKFPNLRNNLTANAYLHDRTLLASLGNPETVRKLAEHNNDFLEAAEFITDYLRTSDTKVNVEPALEEMDSSDSSESPSASSPSTSQGQRITSDQLAEALQSFRQVLATRNSRNSLASISQRNLNTQNAAEPAPSSAAQRITSSMFMNALSDVLRSTRTVNEDRARQSDTPAQPAVATTEAPSAAAPAVPAAPLYLEELRQMQEMGLTDNEINMQALLLTNGDLEGAINIVLSGGMN